MTRDEIIRMAREAGWQYAEEDSSGYDPLWKAMRLAYAAGAAAEREAMLDLVDDYAKGNTDLKAAIRARGQK